MKLYLVSEINRENNMVMKTWVCLTEEKAKECLDYYFTIATHLNESEGLKKPVDTRDMNFFFWDLKTMKLKYEISETKTF